MRWTLTDDNFSFIRSIREYINFHNDINRKCYMQTSNEHLLRIHLVDNISVMMYKKGQNVHINIYMIYKRRAIDEINNYENRCLWGERSSNQQIMKTPWSMHEYASTMDAYKTECSFKVFNKSTKPRSKKNKLSSKSVHNQYVLMNIVKQNIWKNISTL